MQRVQAGGNAHAVAAPRIWELVEQKGMGLRQTTILDSPDDPAIDALATLAAEICDAPMSLISFLDSDREWFKSRVGTSLRSLMPSGSSSTKPTTPPSADSLHSTDDSEASSAFRA